MWTCTRVGTQRSWDPADWRVLCTPACLESPTPAAVDLEWCHGLPACMTCWNTVWLYACSPCPLLRRPAKSIEVVSVRNFALYPFVFRWAATICRLVLAVLYSSVSLTSLWKEAFNHQAFVRSIWAYTSFHNRFVMVALCNRANHYIFILWFLLSFFVFFFFSSPNLSGRRLDVYYTSTHRVALV